MISIDTQSVDVNVVMLPNSQTINVTIEESVSISNFPATQTVDGIVSVKNGTPD